ncbi:MAG: hypothetical protein JSU08_08560 [Acidobacteria bacterium]|nr:hypothetical protein [Acidobacteriota bacterium]
MRGSGSCARLLRIVAAGLFIWIASTGTAHAQLGSLLSPGRLAKAHANLEGLSNCQQCHEQGQKVSATKCLTCHKPVAERIRLKKGVHKDVQGNCIACHAEHAGVDGELRPFDQKSFDHAKVTGFALDGKHANLAAGCAACHQGPSFLTARAECASCHQDVHKPSLGAKCDTCHSTRTAFKGVGTAFDHTRAAFQLQGAHQTVACEKCHVNRTFKGIAFASCTNCHADRHRGSFGATCTTCHTNESWRTKRVDHAKTDFALVGLHQKVDCAACHKQPPMRVALRADTCAACHVDVHRGTFKQDCKACHNENGFGKAPFDHAQTRFALTGKHEALTCEKCHTSPAAQPTAPAAKRVADFRGLSTTCVSCHTDVHQGQLGASCETCHTSASFRVSSFTHKSDPSFFAGQHASLTCEKCHVPSAPRATRTDLPVALNVRYRDLPKACASCHEDAHLGQEPATCETCHTITSPKFAVPGFSHARTSFALTGKHETAACAVCHKRETGQFPKGPGTAIRFSGLAHECRSCHQDVHLGQLSGACETCHATSSFTIDHYTHKDRTLSSLFVGRHLKATCQDCHKAATTNFPAGRGTAVRFKVERTCVSCHTDIHKGALGPNCATCHRP